MASPRIFQLRGARYSADELAQLAVSYYARTADEMLNNVIDMLEAETNTVLHEMQTNTSEPRADTINRQSAFKRVFVRVTAKKESEIRFGPYAGNFISRAEIEITSTDNALNNAFNAMDTGIPEREAKSGKYMRFPRYEGNITRRSGSILPIDRVVTGALRANKITKTRRDGSTYIADNWVTVKKVKPSAPFNLMARLRTKVRSRLRQIRRENLSAGTALDSSKIRISIHPILED